MTVAHETMTYLEIVTAVAPLTTLASRGYKDQKIARKVARMLIWANRQTEEFEAARKILVEGHAKRDSAGEKVLAREQNAETQEWRDVPDTFQLDNPTQFREDFEGLTATEINTNGLRLTERELETCKVAPEPAIYVGLGPLFMWDDEGPDALELMEDAVDE